MTAAVAKRESAQAQAVQVSVPIGPVALDGDLTLPPGAEALVVFAHGTGSSRHSPRNRFVAGELAGARLGTLLLDLLTPDEEERDLASGELRFDIDLLAQRTVGAIDWLDGENATAGLPVGAFGASTGAAAALIAAAERPGRVGAVVSRGGRPDLAARALDRVGAPTLLIVGGEDRPVIAMNRDVMRELRADTQLEIVEGASHLFEEPGALDQVAGLAREWFLRHLRSQDANRASGEG